MKKLSKTILLPALLLIFISAYFWLWAKAAATEAHNPVPYLIAFAIFVILNIAYFLWLAKTKRIGKTTTILYIPAAIGIFYLFIYLILNPFYVRTVHIGEVKDPFLPESHVTLQSKYYIFQKSFFMSKEKLTDSILAEQQKTWQGNLIGHDGTDLQGWSSEKVENTFGEPTKTIEIAEGLEKWIYHPWTNHPDWEMPIYMLNNKLLIIGDEGLDTELSERTIPGLNNDTLNLLIDAEGADPETFYLGSCVYFHGEDGEIRNWQSFSEEKQNSIVKLFKALPTTKLDYSQNLNNVSDQVYIGPLCNCTEYNKAKELINEYKLSFNSQLVHGTDELENCIDEEIK